jgi:hypothetical protein
MPFDPRDLGPPDGLKLAGTQSAPPPPTMSPLRVALSCCLTPGVGSWTLRATRR